MNKSKKIFAIGVAILLLSSMLCIPASASNLLSNPTLSIHDGGIEGWSISCGDLGAEDVVKKVEGMPEAIPGNAFTTDISPYYIKYVNLLPLNSDGRCYITLWYKSKEEKVIRVNLDECNAEGTVQTAKSTTTAAYLPSTDGVWKEYKIIFKRTVGSATHVKLWFRVQDYDTTLATGSEAAVAAPTYSTDVPFLENGEFWNNINSWNIMDVTEGNVATAVDSYLTLEYTSNAITQLRVQNSSMQDATTNTTDFGKGIAPILYKFSFKYKPISAIEGVTCVPRVDIFLNEYVQASGSWSEIKTYQNMQNSTRSVSLGQNEDGWIQYIGYFTVAVGQRVANIRIWNQVLGTKTAYDDFVIEPAKSEFIFYQNGEIKDELVPGTVDIRFQNISQTDKDVVVALYKVDGTIKTIIGLRFLESIAGTDFVNAPSTTLTVPSDGTYEIKAYAFESLANLGIAEGIKVKTLTTSATAQ